MSPGSLEYHIHDNATTVPHVRHTLDAAMGLAAARSAARGGSAVTVDVIAYTRNAARRYGGDHAVEVYDQDPDASVLERFSVRVESQGMIP